MTGEQEMPGNGPRELTVNELDAVGGGTTTADKVESALLHAAAVVGIIALCLL